MSDHLPECPQIFGKPDWYCCEDCDPGVWDDCICDRLRACEQRVNDEWVRDYGGHRAFALGVQAAREAVAALRSEARAYLDAGGNPRHNAATQQAIHNWTQALDAIDALRTTNP